MTEFNKEKLAKRVVESFDYSKVPHTFDPEATKEYTLAIILEAIDLAFDKKGQYVSVEMDEWHAQAFVESDEDIFALLCYSVEKAEAFYLEGNYV